MAGLNCHHVEAKVDVPLYGNNPSSTRALRSLTASGSFICSTTTVALPMAVRPMRTDPSQRKCWDHSCWQGWNSSTIFFVRGSMPLRLGPL